MPRIFSIGLFYNLKSIFIREFCRMNLNDISYSIRGCAFKVHSNLGPGMFEAAYESALAHELKKSRHGVQTQLALPFEYDDKIMKVGYRIDMLVDNQIILEIKSVECLADIHFKQLTTYLKLSDKRLGFLMNFNSISLLDGVSMFRIVNKF